MTSDDEQPEPCAGCDPDNPGGHLPPPRCIDLGNGEAAVFGTAADTYAAAAWLRIHYPDGVTGPRHGPVFGPVLNMSNYRVRQVMAICKRYPQAQKDLLIGLATWLGDETIEVRLANEELASASALHLDTVKQVKRELRKASVIDYEPGRHRGDLTLYRVLILAEGGVNSTPPSEGVVNSTPPSAQKGGSGARKRGGREIR